MENLLKDVRFALRVLRRERGFATTAILTLALGLGGSTAIFSVVESTLLRPLPFRTPHRLALVWGVFGPERDIRGASYVEALDWARLNTTLENVAIYDETSLNLRTEAGTERIDAEMVSASFFPMFGATPQLGRTFAADEDRVPNAFPVVVLSDRIWRSRFGADATIVGRTLILNEVSFTVLGVMKPEFSGLSFDTDVWFPAAMVQANGGPTDLTDRRNRWLGAVARLKDGVTMEEAQRDADRVAAELTNDFPQTNTGRGIQLLTLRQSYLGSTTRLLLSVFAGVGLLLLIACANVAGLQLVRAAAREREMAVRRAIGAEGSRLFQQLIVEGIIIALIAAVAGLLVANWGLAALLLLAPEGALPRYAAPALNLSAFGFTVLVATGCGVLCGVVPALRGSRVDLASALREGSRGSVGKFGAARFGSQQLLVVAQTAFALVLLVGAGLFVRSLARELSVSLGFDHRDLHSVSLSLAARYTPASRLEFAERLQEKVRAIPSVRAVAMASDIPLAGNSNGARIFLPESQQEIRYFRHSVTPDFFAALGIPFVEGQTFQTSDRAVAPAVVVSASAARRLWPNTAATGKRLRIGGLDGTEVTVVGVVGDVRYRDLRTTLATSDPDIYFSLAYRPTADLAIVIRSSLRIESIIEAVRREIATIDPNVPISRVRPMEELVNQQTANGRFASSLLAVFGATALTLTAIGLYALLAYFVGLRRREIGIRIALGATPLLIKRQVLAYGLKLISAGVAVGILAASGITRWISSQLFGIAPHDPVVFIAAPAMLLVIAALASWLPARRAARVDPQLALRLE